MSLKVELEAWDAALKAYDEEDFERSLDLFSRIADSSKIRTNMGLIYATLGEHAAAVEQFNLATQLDQYLAVAYFQCGVSNFLIGRFEFALSDFDEALLHLRKNQTINYEQLGLKFQLYSAEVLFNRGLSRIYLGQVEQGLKDLQNARREKVTEEHNVIDEAIADRGQGYTVFSIPVGVLYRPSENKIKNAKTKDYMGKAKLIATDSMQEAYTGFTGITRKQRGLINSGNTKSNSNDSDSNSNNNSNRSSFDDNSGARSSSLGRSRTVPPPQPRPSARPAAELARPNGLARSRTAGSPSSASRGDGGTDAGVRGATSRPSLRRSATTAVRGGGGGGRSSGSAPNSNGGTGGGSGTSNPASRAASPSLNTAVSRGLSRRRTAQSPRTPGASPLTPDKGDISRVTDIYDDYYNDREDQISPLAMPMPVPPNPKSPSQGQTHVSGGSTWARSNRSAGSMSSASGKGSRNKSNTSPSPSPSPSPSRAPSQRSPVSALTPSSGGGGLRRKPTRRPTLSRGRGTSRSYEEEEGYVSGEYEEGLQFDMAKIRVKLYYQDDVRGMTMTPDTTWADFLARVTHKFNKPHTGSPTLGMKFKDEDGGKITLRDDSDFELAIETARELAKGRAESKLEIWVVDL